MNKFVFRTGGYQTESEFTLLSWELTEEIICEEKCILYSGIIVSGKYDTTLLAGTVFQELVIWSFSNSLRNSSYNSKIAKPVIHRLRGHEGVIFSVNFDQKSRLISTTSDDRTTRLWKVNSTDTNEATSSLNQHSINWQCVEVYLHKVLSGIHVSRVFRSKFLLNGENSGIEFPSVIATAGEDSKICLWNTKTGENIKTFIHDKEGKSPIWSITSISNSKGFSSIYSGGADCGIKMWKYSDIEYDCDKDTIKSNSVEYKIPSEICDHNSSLTDNTTKKNFAQDYPRIVLHAKNTPDVFCLSNSGKVFILNLRKDKEENDCGWIFLMQDSDLFNYALMEFYDTSDVNNLSGKIVFATLNGSLKIYNLFCDSGLNYSCTSDFSCILSANFTNIHQGKIFALSILLVDSCMIKSKPDSTSQENYKSSKFSSIVTLTCGDNGIMKMHCLSVNEPSIDAELFLVNQFQMPTISNKLSVKAQFWFSCAIVIENIFLIIGDRMGNIHLYTLRNSYQTVELMQPCQTLWKIHGRLGVGDMKLSKNSKELWSTGRDGCVRSFKVREKITNISSNEPYCKEGNKQYYLEEISCIKLKISWPEKILIGSNGNIVILGFQSSNFVAYDLEQSIVYCEISCGGSHRSWDYTLSEAMGDFIMTYIKEKHVLHEKVPGFGKKLSRTLDAQNSLVSIIRPSLHSRELTSIHCFKMKHYKNYSFLVTGGEDTALKIHRMLYDNRKLLRQKVATLNGHISNIKCITSLELNDSVILVSAGGRAQLKIWLLSDNQEEFNNSPHATPISCREIAEHMLKGNDKLRKKKSWKTSDLVVEDTETRYMDIDILEKDNSGKESILIAVACSDGVIRLLSVSEDNQIRQNKEKHFGDSRGYSNVWYKNPLSIKVLAQTEIHSHSFLRVKFLNKISQGKSLSEGLIQEQVLILATSTDGKLHRIRFTQDCRIDCDDEPLSLYIEEIAKLHQSGINGLWVAESSPNTNSNYKVLVVTGGDDGSIAAAKLDDNLVLLASTRLSTKQSNPQHSAPVTGICPIFSGDINKETKCDSLPNEEILLKFASCSVDQRICVWKLADTQIKNISDRTSLLDKCPREKELEIVNVTKILSNVPDIQAITSCNMVNLEQNNSEFLVAAGVGVEIFGFS